MTEDVFKYNVSEDGVYIYVGGLYFPISRFIELINEDVKKHGWTSKNIREAVYDEIVLRKYERNNLPPNEPIHLSLWEVEEFCTGKPQKYMRKQTKTKGVI